MFYSLHLQEIKRLNDENAKLRERIKGLETKVTFLVPTVPDIRRFCRLVTEAAVFLIFPLLCC